MYEYKFVKLDVAVYRSSPKENYQEIIVEHGKEGWRLVQILTPISKGFVDHYELIFEKFIE